MKRERRDDAGRDATCKLVRHHGQDVQNLFVGTRVVVVRHNGQDVQNLSVGTRVVVNFRVASQSRTTAAHGLCVVQAGFTAGG